MADSLRTPIGEMWLTDDGVLIHRIEDGLNISVESAIEVKKAVAQLTNNRPVPAVVDMRAVGYADRAAREMFGASTEKSSELATALIVGPISSQTMAQAFIAMGPQRPIEVFTSEEEALDWARSFLPQPKDGSR